MGLYEELKSRGYIKQFTIDESKLKEVLNEEKISIYAGFDPTKGSLHAGHLMPIMLLKHLQNYGHRPLCVMGGATALIGDPSGRDSMREILTVEQITTNIKSIEIQIGKILDINDGKSLLLNNYDWFENSRYLDFIRDIGPYFTVNNMLRSECFKQRMEKGLTFLEFNYMLLQGYDFYFLAQEYMCKMQIGGDDQWSNILAGIDLARRKGGKEVYGVTIPLLTTSSGKKMGKTEGGAVWLDETLTSPYEYFQYWRNIEDASVISCLKLYTFISLDKIAEYEKLEGSDINIAKEVLAYETTKILHGKEAAEKAKIASKSAFSGSLTIEDGAPEFGISKQALLETSILDLSVNCGLFASKGEVKRMIKQGGLSFNNQKIDSTNFIITEELLENGGGVLKKGKKKMIFIKTT